MSDTDDDLVPIDDYDIESGKIQASLRWLVSKVYGSQLPDQLRAFFFQAEEGQKTLKPAVVYSLCSGELYCAAASKIFGDPGFVGASTGNVLAALSRAQIHVEDGESGLEVTETVLSQSAPLRVQAHVAMMDGLMTAHFRHAVSVDRVVEAVKSFSTVGRNEAPLDAEDALLFWINKVCASVRDRVEAESGETPLIPEMEDLYEDLCDGACLATLCHFYAPNALRLSDICFNDPMGIADYIYNLRLVMDFLVAALPPPSPCHFQLEEFMYLHESLKPNVKALFADLFLAFAAPAAADVRSPTATTSRSFTTTQKTLEKMIPNLRSQPPPPAPSAGARHKRGQQSGATSMLNSMDSLMTTRSGDSLKYQTYRVGNGDRMKKSPTTTFGEIPAGSSRSPNSSADSTSNDYRRSDSMPSGPGAVSAGVRLALEEKRRQHDTQRQHLHAQLNANRQQAKEEAFFTLLGKPSSSASSTNLSPRAADRIQPNSSLSGSPARVSNNNKEYQDLNKSVLQLQQQIKRLSVEQERLKSNQSQGSEDGLMETAPGRRSLSSMHLYQGAPPPPPPLYAVPNVASPAVYAEADGSIGSGDGSFRLHDETTPPSRLDPSLHLTRNLTNWGMTYKMQAKPARKTWNSEMFRQALPPQPPPMTSSFHQPTQEDLWMQQQQLQQQHQQIQQQQQIQLLQQQQQELILAQQQQELLLAQQQSPKFQPSPLPSLPSPPFQAWGAAEPTSSQAPVQVTAATPPAPSGPSYSHMEPMGEPAPTPPKPRPEAPKEASPGVGFIVGDSAEERRKNEEMASRRRQLLEAQLKRKAAVEAKRGDAESEAARRRAAEEAKEKDADEKRRRDEDRRKLIFQQYQQKKEAEEAEKNPAPRGPPRLARGHSQPPRPKSTVVARSRADEAPDSPGSVDRLHRLGPVQLPESLAEPKLKVFVKPSAKSNRGLILNSINYCVLAGGVHREMREKVLGELAKSDAKHFLVLFRDGNRMQFRGLYSWDELGDTAHKLCGTGPKLTPESIMDLMYKYDSGAKKFQNVPTRHLSATIDGFTIKDEFWAKKKGPHASGPQRRASNMQ